MNADLMPTKALGNGFAICCSSTEIAGVP